MSLPQQTPSPSPIPIPSPVSVSTHHINNDQIQPQPPLQFQPYDVPLIGALPPHNHPTFPPPSVDSFIGTGAGSSMSHSSSYYNSDNQELTKNSNVTIQQVNVIPGALRCEICDVVGTSKDSFHHHTLGKKHIRNLQKLVHSISMSIQNGTVEQMIPATKAANLSEELEKKKQALLDNGVDIGRILLCTMCNVVCLDGGTLETHVTGRKHAAEVIKHVIKARHLNLPLPSNPICMAVPSQQSPKSDPKKESLKGDVCGIKCYTEEHMVEKKHLKNLEESEKVTATVAITPAAASAVSKIDVKNKAPQNSPGTTHLIVAGPPNPISMTTPSQQPPENGTKGEPMKKSHITPSAWCDVCGVNCNTQTALQVHIFGMQHLKNLEKSEKVTAPVAYTPPALSAVTKVDVKNAELQNVLFGSTHLTVAGPPKPISMTIPLQQPPENDTKGEHFNCNTQTALDVHMVGIQHLKNLEKSEKVSVTVAYTPPAASAVTKIGVKNAEPQNAPFGSTHLTVAGPPNPTSMAIPSQQPLENERKKKKKKKPREKSQIAPHASCDVCGIYCKNQSVLDEHLAGKRHLKRLKNLAKVTAPVASTQAAASAVSKVDVKNEEPQNTLSGTTLPAAPAISKVDLKNKEPQSTPCSTTPPVASAVSKVDVKNEELPNAPFISSRCCSICNVICDSPGGLNIHLSGKKHQRRTKIIGPQAQPATPPPMIGPTGPLAPPAAPPMIGPAQEPQGFKANVAEVKEPENRAKRPRNSNEDVETKRQKIMKDGAPPDLVRACTVCNVVCNSPKAFISHLAGHKHLAMQKEAEAGLLSQNASLSG